MSSKISFDTLRTMSENKLNDLREQYEYSSETFSDADSLLALAEVFLALGKITVARRRVKEFIEKKGDSSRARVILARAHLMSCKTVLAKEEIEKALEIDRQNREAAAILSDIYRNSGEKGKAFRVAFSAVEGSTSPPAPPVFQTRESKPTATQEFLKQDRPRAGVFETEAMLNLYIEQGLYEDAMKVAEALCESEPENQTYKCHREKVSALLSR